MKVFKAGTPVRLIQPEVAGVVVGGKLSASGDEIDYRVLITLPSGESHVREFPSDQLAAAEGEEAEALLKQHDEHIETLKADDARDQEAAAAHNFAEAQATEGKE